MMHGNTKLKKKWQEDVEKDERMSWMTFRKVKWCEFKEDSLDFTVCELTLWKAVDQSQRGPRRYDHFQGPVFEVVNFQGPSSKLHRLVGSSKIPK